MDSAKAGKEFLLSAKRTPHFFILRFAFYINKHRAQRDAWGDRVLFAARSNELILRGCLRDDEFRRHSESEPE